MRKVYVINSDYSYSYLEKFINNLLETLDKATNNDKTMIITVEEVDEV